MKEFFKDIFQYHTHFNQKLTEQLIENRKNLPERSIPLICHSINAHQIWNARITGEKQFGVHQLHSLVECKSIDNENYKNVLKILNERELDEIVTYSNSKQAEEPKTIHTELKKYGLELVRAEEKLPVEIMEIYKKQ